MLNLHEPERATLRQTVGIFALAIAATAFFVYAVGHFADTLPPSPEERSGKIAGPQ